MIKITIMTIIIMTPITKYHFITISRQPHSRTAIPPQPHIHTAPHVPRISRTLAKANVEELMMFIRSAGVRSNSEDPTVLLTLDNITVARACLCSGYSSDI